MPTAPLYPPGDTSTSLDDLRSHIIARPSSETASGFWRLGKGEVWSGELDGGDILSVSMDKDRIVYLTKKKEVKVLDVLPKSTPPLQNKSLLYKLREAYGDVTWEGVAIGGDYVVIYGNEKASWSLPRATSKSVLHVLRLERDDNNNTIHGVPIELGHLAKQHLAGFDRRKGIAVSPKGLIVAIGSHTGPILILDITNPTHVTPYKEPSLGFDHVSFGDNGSKLYASGVARPGWLHVRGPGTLPERAHCALFVFDVRADGLLPVARAVYNFNKVENAEFQRVTFVLPDPCALGCIVATGDLSRLLTCPFNSIVGGGGEVPLSPPCRDLALRYLTKEASKPRQRRAVVLYDSQMLLSVVNDRTLVVEQMETHRNADNNYAPAVRLGPMQKVGKFKKMPNLKSRLCAYTYHEARVMLVLLCHNNDKGKVEVVRFSLPPSIGVEEEAVTESPFHTTVDRPLAVQGGSAQKHSGTSGQEDGHHKRGPLLPPDEAVQAFQSPSHWAVHLAGNDEADDAPRGEIFRTQDGAFQTGRHAKPANWLQDLKMISLHIMKIPGQCELRPRAIRVAILDTGVNLDRRFFKSRVRQEKIREHADFTPGGRPGEDPVDTFGHGSLMAQLLMEVAPMADVYIARVAADTDSLSGSKAAIAQAIKWADNQDVDIISMSFGFDENDPSISKAIESVHTRRDGSVIFVASAGNSLYEPEKFPARHSFVIAIYATDIHGAFANTNPPLTGDSGPVFGTYGDLTPSHFTEEYGSTICKPGSSVATVIAAAIATIMLAYIESLPWVGLAVVGKVKMDQELERRREKLLNLQKLRTKDGMSSLFNRMVPDKTQQRRWISPIWFWNDRLHHGTRETALLEVANNVRIPVPVRQFDRTAPH